MNAVTGWAIWTVRGQERQVGPVQIADFCFAPESSPHHLLNLSLNLWNVPAAELMRFDWDDWGIGNSPLPRVATRCDLVATKSLAALPPRVHLTHQHLSWLPSWYQLHQREAWPATRSPRGPRSCCFPAVGVATESPECLRSLCAAHR